MFLVMKVCLKSWSLWETHREASPQPPPAANEEPGPSGAQSAGEGLDLFTGRKENSQFKPDFTED